MYDVQICGEYQPCYLRGSLLAWISLPLIMFLISLEVWINEVPLYKLYGGLAIGSGTAESVNEVQKI